MSAAEVIDTHAEAVSTDVLIPKTSQIGVGVNEEVVFGYFDKLVQDRLTSEHDSSVVIGGGLFSIEKPASKFTGSVVALQTWSTQGNASLVGNGLLGVRCFLDTSRPDYDASRRGYVRFGMLRRILPTSVILYPDYPLGFNLPYEDVIFDGEDLCLPPLYPQFPVSAIKAFLDNVAQQQQEQLRQVSGI